MMKTKHIQNVTNKDGSKDLVPSKMELPVTTVNSFIAINL